MQVFVSPRFENYLSENARDALISAFKFVKSSPNNEYKSALIGKDSAFIEPQVNGAKYALRHCHLIPLADKEALIKWTKDHRRSRRKTSNRVLIYVQRADDFYLIDVVDDPPGAHEIMKMVDFAGKSFMLKCAQEADAFFYRAITPALV